MPLDYLNCVTADLSEIQGNVWFIAKRFNVFTRNLEFSPHSEVKHGTAIFKPTKGQRKRLKKNYSIMTNYSIWYFWSSFHFLHSNVPGNKCHKKKWCVLFFTHIKLVASVLAWARAIARIKWRRLQMNLAPRQYRRWSSLWQ